MTAPVLGQVFTPARLADALWAHAIAALPAGDGPLRVVEPAAGDGALVRAGRHALAALERPVDGVAVELDPTWLPELRAAAGPWTVVHADALSLVGTSAPPTALGQAAGAMDPDAVRSVVPWLGAPGAVDLVVANPPWVRETGHAALFRALRAWHGGHHADACPRNADLSHVFVAQILGWLRPGGIAALLMPAYWMDTDVGARVRRRLLDAGDVRMAWRAGAATWFDGASVEASFVVWQKASRRVDGASVEDLRAETAIAGADPAQIERRAVLPDASAPWTLRAPVTLPTEPTVPLGDHWRIIEGVSTGANRLRARDVDRIAGGVAGEGILVLSDDEVAALGLDGHPSLQRRHPASRSEWIVRVRDGDLPALDRDPPTPRTPLEAHLARFAPVLARRAEMRRNRSRSWYAAAWPRPELDAPGCVVTAKWARTPHFEVLPRDTVAMTDQRVLVPKSRAAAEAADGLVAWLNGAELAAWWQANARRRGAMMEFYGAMLAGVPVPARLVTATACSTR